jgi:hypothetical protein
MLTRCDVASGRARVIFAICGLLAGPALVVGTLAGAAAQPDEFSLVNDPPSDLGAYTAESPWVANQIGSNLAGVLLFVFAIGLWRSLGRHPSERIGSALVALAGFCIFLTGFLRLDCREIDAACGNSSWHAQSHLALAAITALVLVLAPFVVARALKLTQNWRDLWVPTLGFAIGTVVAGVAGSAVGGGLGSLLAALVWFTWIAMLAVRMLRQARPGGIGEPTASAQALH